jgi:WD40 repeat protein
VFYTSRFAVIYNTVKSTQSFYQGHKIKISAICKHPHHAVVATGEVTHTSPSIHVWDAGTMETLVTIKTSHKGGILHLAFSSDGTLLVSIGMDKTFSMQVF